MRRDDHLGKDASSLFVAVSRLQCVVNRISTPRETDRSHSAAVIQQPSTQAKDNDRVTPEGVNQTTLTSIGNRHTENADKRVHLIQPAENKQELQAKTGTSVESTAKKFRPQGNQYPALAESSESMVFNTTPDTANVVSVAHAPLQTVKRAGRHSNYSLTVSGRCSLNSDAVGAGLPTRDAMPAKRKKSAKADNPRDGSPISCPGLGAGRVVDRVASKPKKETQTKPRTPGDIIKAKMAKQAPGVIEGIRRPRMNPRQQKMAAERKEHRDQKALHFQAEDCEQ